MQSLEHGTKSFGGADECCEFPLAGFAARRRELGRRRAAPPRDIRREAHEVLNQSRDIRVGPRPQLQAGARQGQFASDSVQVDRRCGCSIAAAWSSQRSVSLGKAAEFSQMQEQCDPVRCMRPASGPAMRTRLNRLGRIFPRRRQVERFQLLCLRYR
jgi:hypothetical protein